MKEKKNLKQRELPVIIPSEHLTIYATGAYGGYSPHDFRVLLYSEEPLQQDEIILTDELQVMREIKAQLVLAPLAAKQTAIWLTKQVEMFEKEFGEIPEPKKETIEENE